MKGHGSAVSSVVVWYLHCFHPTGNSKAIPQQLDKMVYTNYILRHIPKGGAMAGECGRCPNCGGDRVVKAGKYNRGEKGLEQRYLCKDCHKFTTKPVRQLELIKSQELLR